MVEKIIVSPESIRGLGNIVMPKTGADFRSVDCTVLVGTDTVNDETVTVFTLESDVTLLSVVLSVDDASVVVGESVTLSATVTDEMTQPVEGATVSFKLNGNVLGTSDTNSSGVATYSYTTVSDGTLVFSSVCSNNSSNSVNVTVTGHNYSLEFDSTDYTVIGGSVVIKVGLTDNSAVVPNVSVSLSGGGSSWSATTDNTGVATFNLSNVTTGGTYTASYNGATATANVVIQTYLFYDSCASDNTSQYTNFYEIWASSTTVRTSLSFDTDHYVLTNSNANFSTVCLPVTAGLDDWVLTAKIRAVSSSSDKGGGVAIAQDKEKGVGLFQPNSKTTKHLILYNPNMTGGGISSNVAVSNLTTNDYNTYELTKDGTSLTFKIYNSGGTQVFSKVVTIQSSSYLTSAYPALSIAKSDSVYIKEIKLESL